MKENQNMRLCAVRLPPEFWDELNRLAKERYITPSAIIRQAVGQYLKTIETKEASDEHAK